MNFGRNNYFDDNRRSNFRNEFDNGQSFGSNFENMRRQRSPIFNRDNFESQMPSNYTSSFPNSNFGYQPKQQNESSKVYQIPIHVETDDNTINNQNNLNNNYQNNKRLNNSSPFNQHQTFYTPKQQQPTSNFNNSNDFESEFRRRQEEMRRKQDEFRMQQDDHRNRSTGNNRSTTGNSNEFKIPIRIEGDESNESNNLARDFNNMHYPPVRENKPGQKASHNQNEQFTNTREFNTPSYDQQSQFNNQQDQSYSHHYDNQQSNQQSNQQQQQQQQPNQQQQQPSQSNIKKPTDPMTIVQNTLEEVEKYEHEIDYFTGEYQDKQYRYLDEYLTRCMLKLDTIDTNGDQNLKQARKNALNYINRVIGKLEKIEKKDNEKTDVDQKEMDTNKKEELDQDKEIKNDDELKKGDNNSKEDKNDDNKQDNSTIEKKEQEKVSTEKKTEKKKSTKTDTKEKKKIKKDDKK